MKKRNILIGIVVIFIAMQFYRPNKPVFVNATLDDFLLYEKAPKEVANLFKTSCYNCHSDQTETFWHNTIAPVSWWTDGHVKEARSNLNFSNWATYDTRDKRAKLSAIAVNIKENTMPLKSYVLAHSEAKLSEEEKKKIMDWLFTVDTE